MGRAGSHTAREIAAVDAVDGDGLPEGGRKVIRRQGVSQQSGRQHLSLGEDQTVTEPRGNLLDVMGDQHQSRRIGVGGQIGQAGDQIFPAAEVQAGGGLVEQPRSLLPI